MLGKSKVLDTNIEWYDEIDPLSFYEKHFEETFLSKVSTVYPEYIGVPFALPITSEDGEISKPDLAIIKKDYTEWIVIEVEMGRHSWDGHVDKQVRVFSKGIYEKKRIADYIIDKDNSLDYNQLKKMIEDASPRVMVIVNEHKPEWKKKIKKYKALLSVFQIYKGVNGLEVYRVEGDTPYVYRHESHCEFLKGVSNTMHIFTPSFITEPDGTDITIVFRNKSTKWKVVRDEDEVYVVVHGSVHSFQLEKKYILYKSPQNEYFIELN